MEEEVLIEIPRDGAAKAHHSTFQKCEIDGKLRKLNGVMVWDACVVHIVMDNGKLKLGQMNLCVWCFVFGSNAKEIVSSIF